MVSDPITIITIYYFVRIIFYDLCASWIGSIIEIGSNKYQSKRSLSSRFVPSFPLFSITVITDCSKFLKRVPAYVNILPVVSRLRSAPTVERKLGLRFFRTPTSVGAEFIVEISSRPDTGATQVQLMTIVRVKSRFESHRLKFFFALVRESVSDLVRTILNLYLLRQNISYAKNYRA